MADFVVPEISGSSNPQVYETARNIALVLYKDKFISKFFEGTDTIVMNATDGAGALQKLESLKQTQVSILMLGSHMFLKNPTSFDLVKIATSNYGTPAIVFLPYFEKLVDVAFINKPFNENTGFGVLILSDSPIVPKQVVQMFKKCFKVVRGKHATMMNLEENIILVLVDSCSLTEDVVNILKGKQMSFVILWDTVVAIDMEWTKESKLAMVMTKPLDGSYKRFLLALALSLAAN